MTGGYRRPAQRSDVRRRGIGRKLRFPQGTRMRSHFTPCISLLISGATSSNSTPETTSAQKPKV